MDYRKLADEFMKSTFGKEPPMTPPDDMNKGEIGILTYLSFIKDRTLSGDLSKGLNLTSGRIAIALKSLEKKGYIRREKDAIDRRKVIVRITSKGKEHALSQKEHALDDLTKLLEHLGEEDAKEFIRILYKFFGID